MSSAGCMAENESVLYAGEESPRTQYYGNKCLYASGMLSPEQRRCWFHPHCTSSSSRFAFSGIPEEEHTFKPKVGQGIYPAVDVRHTVPPTCPPVLLSNDQPFTNSERGGFRVERAF